MGESIKKKSLYGLIWSGIDKFALEMIQFIIGIVLARLLMPSDYGLIGILMVFVSFSVIFIDGGVTKALVQKIDRTDDDFNTAFIYNLFSSIFIYFILFICAPYIASWYDKPELKLLLRVLSINLIISAFAAVQNTKFTIAVDFKKLSIISVSSAIVSGILSVILAYNGAGVWSLVFQQIINNLCKTILLNILSSWKPRFCFSVSSFKFIFDFGYKLVLTNVLARIYSNLYPLIIGKLFPMNILGFYTRGQHYAVLPINIMKTMFTNVSFPVLSSIKQDNDRLCKIYRIYIEMSSFLIFPVMFIVIVISKPLILVMLTNKWIEAVPFMQILCIGLMFDHINSINLNLLFVKGRTDLALKLEILKKTIALTILFISTIWGIWGICLGQALYCFIATFLNSIYTKKLIGLSYRTQANDFMKVWLIALLASILPFYIEEMCDNSYGQIIIGIFTYFLSYAILHFIIQSHSGKYFMAQVREYYNKRKQ